MEPNDDGNFTVRAVGIVSSSRQELVRRRLGRCRGRHHAAPAFDSAAVAGLSEFSHLEVVFLFDQVDPASVCTGSRRPRGNPAWPEVGHLRPEGEGQDQPHRA